KTCYEVTAKGQSGVVCTDPMLSPRTTLSYTFPVNDVDFQPGETFVGSIFGYSQSCVYLPSSPSIAGYCTSVTPWVPNGQSVPGGFTDGPVTYEFTVAENPPPPPAPPSPPVVPPSPSPPVSTAPPSAS